MKRFISYLICTIPPSLPPSLLTYSLTYESPSRYDVSNDQTVSKQELEVLLNHIPKAILGSSDTLNNVSTGSLDSSEVPSLLPDDNDTYTKVDSYTNHGIAEKAFEECDLRHEGIHSLTQSLSYLLSYLLAYLLINSLTYS